MTKIFIYKNKKGIITAFKTEGHAEFDRYGKDIVCSAISVLVFNTINSIEKFTSDKFDLQMNEEKGIIEFKLIDNISDNSILLMKSLELGLQGIKDSYGKDFIKIKIKEV